jgi:hypothetical protein
MRLCRLLILLVAVAALTACARQPARQYYAASPPYAPQQHPSLQYHHQQQQQYPQQRYTPPVPQADLDTMMYGAPAPYRQPQPGYRPAYAPPRYAQPGYAPPRYAPPNYSPPGYRPPPIAYYRPPARMVRPAKPYIPIRALPIDDGPYTLDTGDGCASSYTARTRCPTPTRSMPRAR